MPSVLIVDDESFRDTAAREFRRKGWTVETAADGVEALVRLDTNPLRFDAIILDRTMPNMNGDEVLRDLYDRRLLLEICVVVLTGHYEEQTDDRVRDSLRQGAWHYIAKPANIDQLIAAMAPGIAMKKCHRLRRELCTQSPDQVLRTLGSVLKTLGPDACHLIYIANNRTIDLLTREEVTPEGRRFVREIRDGALFIHTQSERATVEMEPVCPGSKSLMAVPVESDGSRVIGILEFESEHETPIDIRWQEVLLYLADLISFSRLKSDASDARAAAAIARAEAAEGEALNIELLYREVRHMIATSATVVAQRSKTLRMELPTSSPHYGTALTIAGHAERVCLAIEELKQLADTRAEEAMPASRSRRDVSEIVADAVKTARSRTDEWEIAIGTNIKPRLFAKANDRILYCVECLIDNAIDATLDRGSQDPDFVVEGATIEVDCVTDGADVCISVTDHGIGLNDRVRESLFRPLFTTKARGRKTKTGEQIPERSHAGIGLYTVRRVVERQHQGKVEVASDGDFKGATFTIRMPKAE